MTDTSSPESAVRKYLSWINDPSSVVDADAVAKADAAFASATDPIDRLRAAADRENAKSADTDALVGGFIAHARGYSEAEGIPAEAFRQVGVTDDVLTKAGFRVGRRKGRGPARVGGPRTPQVGVQQLKESAAALPKKFTLIQLAEKAGGGSPATVRKAVDQLIDEGWVAKVGPDQNHQGPGRAPTIYELR